MLEIGQPIPSFTLMSDTAGEVSSAQLLGQRYVIFAYPKDDTYGWTIEAAEFRDRIPQFSAKNVAVYGISPDDLDSHRAFAEKNNLNFPLLADIGHVVIDSFGFWGERERDGKKFMSVLRSSVLVGTDGRVEQVWKSVNFQGHADEVLAAL